MATKKHGLTDEEYAIATAAQARGNEKRRKVLQAAANEGAPPPSGKRSSAASAPAPLGSLFAIPPMPPLRTWTCGQCQKPYTNPWNLGTCPDCEQRAVLAADEARRQKIRDEVLSLAGADFAHVTLDHPKIPLWCKPSREVAKARAAVSLTYDEEQERWPLMLLLGNTGAGKTTLGSAIFRHHLERALADGEAGERRASRMVWVAAVDLARARRESPLGHTPELYARARYAPVLLLDDLGQELPQKDDTIAILMERQKNRVPTIVTCGFSTADIDRLYGDFFVRRLTERAHVIRLEGKRRGTP